MPKLTKTSLRARKIHSEYGLASLQDEPQVWVSFAPYDQWHSGGWRVHRVGYQTLNKYEDKNFLNRDRHDKEAKRLEAIAWASERYKIDEWEKSPFGSYHPVGAMARAAAMPVEVK